MNLPAERAAWAQAEVRALYEKTRRSPSELYPSERFFLPEILPRVKSCLDVGCAAGGFFAIMRSFNPHLQYTGVDVVPEMVEAARRDYPEGKFLVGDGVNFSTPAETYDLVHSSGVLHLAAAHREMVRACYAQARRYLLCDFRLARGPAVTGRLRLAQGALPYFVLNVDDLLGELRALRPAPRAIRARGYSRAPSADVELPLSEVTMAFFLIEKGGGAGETIVELALDEAKEGKP